MFAEVVLSLVLSQPAASSRPAPVPVPPVATKSAPKKLDASGLFPAINGNRLDTVKEIIESNPQAIEAIDNQNSKRRPLHYAAQSRRIPIVKYLIEQGAKTDAADNYGYTPLHLAVMNRSDAVVDLLLAAKDKPDIDAMDRGKRTPLIYAVQYGQAGLADKLIKAGADINAKDSYDRTAAHFAFMYGRADVAQSLMKHEKLDLNVKDKGGFTPAWYAVSQAGNWERNSATKGMFQKVIDAGADLDVVTNSKQNMLHAAASTGQGSVIKMVLDNSKLDIDAVDTGGRSPLHYVIQSGNAEGTKVLLDAGADPNVSATPSNQGTPLMLAARYYAPMTKLLLDVKAKPNVQDTAGNTALHYAAMNNQQESIAALLNSGADANIANKAKQTPLQVAAAGEKFAAVNLLFPVSKSLTINTDDGENVLHWAAKHGLDQAVPKLIARKVDPNEKNKAGMTPLYLAAQHGHGDTVVALLATEKSVKVDAEQENGETALHAAVWSGVSTSVESLLDAGADPSRADETGFTPLHAAAWTGNLTIVQELLKAGAKSTPTKSGSTPLHAAAWKGHTEAVRTLIAAGADVNATDSDGQTPLHKAAYAGNAPAAAVLIAGKAEATLKDKAGYTARTYAENQGHKSLAASLPEGD